MNNQIRIPGNTGFVKTGKNTSYNMAIVIFEEDNITFCYCPVLDITGYGYNEREAMESFEIMLSEYLDYTEKMKTLKGDLIRIGWQNKGDGMIPPQISELVNGDEEFKRIFNSYTLKTIIKSVQIPSFA